MKELVTLHGGSVGVTSEVGVGSCFFVWIPRGSVHLPQDKVFAPEGAEQVRGNDVSEIEMDEAPGSKDKSAMDRWNATSRGMERASVLEVRYVLLLVQLSITNTLLPSKLMFGSTNPLEKRKPMFMIFLHLPERTPFNDLLYPPLDLLNLQSILLSMMM